MLRLQRQTAGDGAAVDDVDLGARERPCAAVVAALIVPDRPAVIVTQTIGRPAAACGRNASSNEAGVGCAVVGSTLRLASLR